LSELKDCDDSDFKFNLDVQKNNVAKNVLSERGAFKSIEDN